MKETKGEVHSAREGMNCKYLKPHFARVNLNDIGWSPMNRGGLGVSSDHLQILVSDLKDEMTHGERLQYQYVAREHSLSRPAGQPQLGSMFTGLGQRSLMVEYPEDDSAQYMCRSCLAARFIYN